MPDISPKSNSSDLERTIDIFVRLAEMQVKLLSIETKITEIASFVSKLQDVELEVQKISGRVGVLENNCKQCGVYKEDLTGIKAKVAELDSSKKNTEKKAWDIFMTLLPHIITATVAGAVVLYSKK